MSSNSLTSPPSKILLSSSTKLSLHDRFTKLAKVRPQTENKKADVKPAALLAAASPASARNRRLALQMASRPSVQAALKLKKKSIRQRIGGFNVAGGGGGAGGLNLNTRRSNNNRNQNKSNNVVNAGITIGGIDPSRLSIGGVPFLKKNSLSKRLSGGRQNIGALKARLSGAVGNRIKRVGAGGGRLRLNRNSFNKNGAAVIKSPNKMVNKRFKRKRLGNNLNNSRQNRGPKNNTSLNRGGNRNKQQPQAQKPKTKEGLDMDLDSYMAKSKSHLDADLDVYMSQANSTATS